MYVKWWEIQILGTEKNKTKEDFSPETRPCLIGLKNPKKILMIRLIVDCAKYITPVAP